MRNPYNVKLDRLITHFPQSHQFIMDELELGARVAMALHKEDQAWWEVVGNTMISEFMDANFSKGCGGFNLASGLPTDHA